MLKAADALASAGASVRVVSSQLGGWATSADLALRGTRRWAWDVVTADRRSAPRAYLWSGVRFRLARAVMARLARSGPWWLGARAYRRMHPELVGRAAGEAADLYYGGGGAIAVAAEAARRRGARYALDLEDFYSGVEAEAAAPSTGNRLAELVERQILAGAAFLTAGSEAVATAYAGKYGVHPIAINNTFPLPPSAPSLTPTPGEGLRLYWFSQTVGPGRGLEDVVEAMGRAGIPGALELRGQAIPDYLDGLQRRAARVAPALRVVHRPPEPPGDMVELCRGYDVGLAVEPGSSPNNLIALSNKACTYVLAGLAVVLTDTPGHRALARDAGEGALTYAPGDVAALAAGLRRWADDRAALARAMAASWEAARRRWHWEHPLERGSLLDAAATALAA
jgi:hypothetical protein